MFANCSLGGMAMGMPDVILVPAAPAPIPTPGPNTANLPLAIPPTANMKCLIMAMPTHHMMTMIPTSISPAVGAGVASGICMGPMRYLKGSTKVFQTGMPTTRMLDNGLSNLTNCPVTCLAPSQTKVIMMS